MGSYPDFEINPLGFLSEHFLERNILSFQQAAEFISQIPYGRNSNKNDLISVFTDNCGTCSTKHALLKRLAEENKFDELKLMIGIYKMNPRNTPAVSFTLGGNGLEYIPEAHCYLKYNGQILDYTKAISKRLDFIGDLIEEIAILPEQITDYKVSYHRNYLVDWLKLNTHVNLTIDEIWLVREQCIFNLSDEKV